MYYISEKTDTGKYGVLDTKDNVVEYYTPRQLVTFVERGFQISGVIYDRGTSTYAFQVKSYTKDAINRYDRCSLMLNIAKYVTDAFNIPSNVARADLASFMLNVRIENEYYALDINDDIYINVLRQGSDRQLDGCIFCGTPEKYGEDFVAFIGGTRGNLSFNSFNFLKSMVHIAKNGMYYDYKSSDLARVIEIATEIVNKYNLVDLPDDIDYFGKGKFLDYISCAGIYGDTVIYKCYKHITGDRDFPFVTRVKPTGQKTRACVNDGLNSIDVVLFKCKQAVLQLSLDMNNTEVNIQEVNLDTKDPLIKRLEPYCLDTKFAQILRHSVGSIANPFLDVNEYGVFLDEIRVDIRKYKKYREPIVTFYPNSLDIMLFNTYIGDVLITYSCSQSVSIDKVIRDLNGNKLTEVNFISFRAGAGVTNCLPEKPFTCDVSNGVVIRAKLKSTKMDRELDVIYKFNGYDIPKIHVE